MQAQEIKKTAIWILISVYLITQGMLGCPELCLLMQTFKPLIRRDLHSAADNKH